MHSELTQLVKRKELQHESGSHHDFFYGAIYGLNFYLLQVGAGFLQSVKQQRVCLLLVRP